MCVYLVIPRDSQKPSHLSLAPKTTPTIILCIGFSLSPHASMTPLFLRTFPVDPFAPFSLSSGEAANRPMRLKWFPLLRRRRAHPPPILAPEQKPLLAPWRAEPQNRKGTESGRPLGQVCTILQIQVKCLLSLLVVIAIWMKVGQICFPFIRLKISLCWNLNLSTCVCQPLILNIRRLLLRNWGPCLYFAKPPYFGSTLSRETSTGFLVHSH